MYLNEISVRNMQSKDDSLLKLHSIPHKDNTEYKPIKLYNEILKYEKLAKIALTTPKEHKYVIEVARKLDNGGGGGAMP